MKTSTVVSVSAATLLSAGVAYAFYFDYRRRNDPAYRKNLRAQQKKAAAAKGGAADPSSSSTTSASIPRTPAEKAAALERAYAEVKRAQKEEAPKDFAQLRTYFDRHVALGEELSSKGPAAQYDAAVAFMKALGVYVEPLELLEIYSKALSKEIYAIVMELIAKDMIENTAGAASAAAVSEMAGGGAAAPGGAAARSAELNSIDGDEAGPTAATPAPATATTAPTDTVETPSADTSAPAPAPVPATEPTTTTPAPAPDSDNTAPTSSSQTANSSSDEMLGSTTGPASTTSSQEWDAISASSAIGHTPAAATGTAASAPAPATEEEEVAPVPAPVEAEAEEEELTPAPAAVDEPAPIETTTVEPVTAPEPEPVPEPESTAPAEEEEEDSSFIYAPSTPAPAPGPEPTASHPAEPVLSQVDVVGEQDDDDEAQQDEAVATATPAVELEELEPDAVGESVSDPPEVAPPAPAAPADVFSSFETVPPPVFSEPEREEEEEEDDDDEEEGEVATASTTGSWASVQPVGSMPKSPSGGNRDSPRWS